MGVPATPHQLNRRRWRGAGWHLAIFLWERGNKKAAAPARDCRSCSGGSCKSVSRIWSARPRRRAGGRGGHHLSGTTVADRLERPTCTDEAGRLLPTAAGTGATWPCTPWGLPGRSGHPKRRCALTAPLHPLPRRPSGRDCSLLHEPSRRCLSARLPVRKHGALWCSDFPHRRPGKVQPGRDGAMARFARPCMYRAGGHKVPLAPAAGGHAKKRSGPGGRLRF